MFVFGWVYPHFLGIDQCVSGPPPSSPSHHHAGAIFTDRRTNVTRDTRMRDRWMCFHGNSRSGRNQVKRLRRAVVRAAAPAPNPITPRAAARAPQPVPTAAIGAVAARGGRAPTAVATAA